MAYGQHDPFSANNPLHQQTFSTNFATAFPPLPSSPRQLNSPLLSNLLITTVKAKEKISLLPPPILQGSLQNPTAKLSIVHDVNKLPGNKTASSPLSDRPIKRVPSPISKEQLPLAQPAIAAPNANIAITPQTTSDSSSKIDLESLEEELASAVLEQEEKEKKLAALEKNRDTAAAMAKEILYHVTKSAANEIVPLPDHIKTVALLKLLQKHLIGDVANENAPEETLPSLAMAPSVSSSLPTTKEMATTHAAELQTSQLYNSQIVSAEQQRPPSPKSTEISNSAAPNVEEAAIVQNNSLLEQASPSSDQLKEHHKQCELHSDYISHLKEQCKALQKDAYRLRTEYEKNLNVPDAYKGLTAKKFDSDASPEKMKKDSANALEESKKKVEESKKTPLDVLETYPTRSLSDSYHLLLGRATALHSSLSKLLAQGNVWLEETEIVSNKKHSELEEKIRLQMTREAKSSPAQTQLVREQFRELREKCSTQHKNILTEWLSLEKLLTAEVNFDLNVVWTACVLGPDRAYYPVKCLAKMPQQVAPWELKTLL